MSRDVWVSLTGGEVVYESVDYDVKHVEHDGGEAHTIELTLNLGGLSVTVDFPLNTAEAFLGEFRDEIVRAKRTKLEWETDTDPSTGVPDAEGCAAEISTPMSN